MVNKRNKLGRAGTWWWFQRGHYRLSWSWPGFCETSRQFIPWTSTAYHYVESRPRKRSHFDHWCQWWYWTRDRKTSAWLELSFIKDQVLDPISEQGAKVTAQYNTTSDILQDLQGSPNLFLVGADLTSESAVKSIFASAVGRLGTVHVLVVSHGVWIRDDVFLKDMSLERWNETMYINLTSTFLVTREFLRGVEDAKTRGEDPDKIDKASIVFVGSNGGRIGEAMHADYSSAKSAMMYGLTLSLKNEIVKIAPKGRVNCVAPAWVYTPMAADALKDPAVVYQSLATTPMKKFGDPFDIAAQIAILASAKVSGHVTGQVVYVTGGMEGRLLNVKEDLQG